MVTKIVQLSEGAVVEILGRIDRLEGVIEAIERTYRLHPCRGNPECWLCLLRNEMDRETQKPLPKGIESVVVRG